MIMIADHSYGIRILGTDLVDALTPVSRKNPILETTMRRRLVESDQNYSYGANKRISTCAK